MEILVEINSFFKSLKQVLNHTGIAPFTKKVKDFIGIRIALLFGWE